MYVSNVQAGSSAIPRGGFKYLINTEIRSTLDTFSSLVHSVARRARRGVSHGARSATRVFIGNAFFATDSRAILFRRENLRPIRFSLSLLLPPSLLGRIVDRPR